MEALAAGLAPLVWVIGGACLGTATLWFVLVRNAVDMDEYLGRAPRKPAPDATPRKDAA
jgi:hypothetical protein